MDPSRGHHQEIMANPSSETMAVNSKGNQKPKPQPEQPLKCPRCDSPNTKFCYYNNYSLSQPRYFCKSCKRYWTQGGTLRNVPVGGGCRKNKRSSSRRTQDQASAPSTSNPLMINTHNNIPPLIYDHHNNHIDTNDLTSAFAMLQKQYDHHHHDGDHDHLSILGNPSFNNPAFFGNQSFCNYGFGEVDNGVGSVSFNGDNTIPYSNEEIVNSTTTTASDVAVTTMKHDLDLVSDHNTLLWGLPWQLLADHGHNNNNNNNNMMGDWQGLLNAPLM